MSNLHPTFETILKPHLQGQRIVKRRDLDRYKALSAVHAELELAGAVIGIDQLDWAVSEVTNRLHEASLDRQYAYEQERSKALADLRKAEDAEAEREERRQYRAWRNDSGV